MRATALLPLFGYLIIYSDQMQEWFNINALNQTFYMSSEWRYRLLYYGGLLVLVSLTLFQIRCPKIIKRFASRDAALESYRNSGSTGMIADIFNFISHHQAIAKNTSSYHIAVYMTAAMLMNNIASVDRSKVIDTTWSPSHNYANYSKQYENFVHELYKESDVKIFDHFDFYELSQETIDLIPSVSNLNSVQQFLFALILRHYDANDFDRIFSRCAAAAIGLLGILCLLAPALETLLIVLSLDLFSWL